MNCFKNLGTFCSCLLLSGCFLVLCGSSNELQAQRTVYEIEVETANNGTDKPIYIMLMGVKGNTRNPFKLDAPGDDFERGAINKFVYESDKDLGDITDIALKGSHQDHWIPARISINRSGGEKYNWTAFRGEKITGAMSDLFRADGVISLPIAPLTLQTVKVTPPTVRFLNNLDGRLGEAITKSEAVSHSVTNSVQQEDSKGESQKNNTGVDLEVSVEHPVGISAKTSFHYAYELIETIAEKFTLAKSENITSNKNYDITAYGGEIVFLIVDFTESRKTSYFTRLDGEREDIWEVTSISESHTYRRFTDPSQIPQDLLDLANTSRPSPRNPSLPSANPTAPGPGSKPILTVDSEPVEETGNYYEEAVDTDNYTTDGNISQVTVVTCVDSYFTKDEGSKNWSEVDEDGNVKFRFKETLVEESAITIYDGTRGVTLCLNLDTMEVLYSDRNNKTPFFIFSIVNAY